MRRAGVWLAAALIVAAPARAAEGVLGAPEIVPLKNGLRLVLATDPQAQSVDVAVWYDAGSRHDKPGKSGVSHLFEHLMFRGSANVGPDEHSRRVRAEGGTSGAYAAHDYMAFYETLPPDALELAFRLEADRMTGLQLTQQGLDEEKAKVGDERARRATTVAVGVERLYQMAFAGHPYGTSVFGLDSELGGLTLSDFREFYRARFGPGRAVVTVVGNFRRDDAVALAKRYLEPLKGSGGAAASSARLKPQAADQRATERGNTPVRVLMLGWRVPARSDPEWASYSVLSTLLTRANDAPISKALIVERPLCLSVQGDVDSRREASLFYLAVAVAPSADSAEVERALMAELERAGREAAPESALERAKRQTETGVWFGLQTTRGRGQALGTGMMLAEAAGDLDRLLTRVRACSTQDVQRAAQRLAAAKRNTLWLMPAQTPDPRAGGRP